MQRIDIGAICEALKLDLNDVAAQLFPNNKHSRLALNRVLKQKASLDEEQISKFSLMTGIGIGDLFTGSGWTPLHKGNIHVFSNGDFRAELDTTVWSTKLFHKKTVFHEHIIHDGSITLSSYLKLLNSEIVKYTADADFRT